MNYSFEFKKNCVLMYYQGLYLDVPEGLTKNYFQHLVRRWVRISENQGLNALKNKTTNKIWTAEEKYKLIIRVIAGESIKSVAFSSGAGDSQLSRWVRNYKILGYNGLEGNKNRYSEDPYMKNEKPPRKLDESEYEELIRLRSENEYIKAEIEVIKKQMALRHEKWAAQLKAKKQQSSKISGEKDIN